MIMDRSEKRNAERPPPGCLRSISRFRAHALEVPVFFICLIVFGTFAAGVYGAMEPRSIDMDAVLGEPDEAGNVIPDFSSVGYMGGGVELPDVPAVKTLYPGSGACDRERIQSALDKIGRMEPCGEGFRGALLLRAGEYRVAGPLWIWESGVVLRGEGQFEGGTTIINTRRETELTFAQLRVRHQTVIMGRPEVTSPRLGFLEKTGASTEITGRVPAGSMQVDVEDTEGFREGDDVVVELRPNIKWLETLNLEDYWATWIYHLYERRITGIEGRRLFLDAPMVHYVEPELFDTLSVWSYSGDSRISKSGVEELRLVASYNEDDPADGSNSWNAVHINQARDCWVRGVTALHFQMSAVYVGHEARNITVEDCAYIRPVSMHGHNRYAFFLGGSMSLVQRCYAHSARHAFASSSRCTGPNVFLDCFSERDFSVIGPHMRWDTGYLYDNVFSPAGRISVQHFTATHHRWRGANHVFWNCKASQMVCDSPRTGDTNWSVGNIAARSPGIVHEEAGHWISHGRRVSPRSLYLRQLEDRSGREAVKNITRGIQRQGDAGLIIAYLKNTFSELNERERLNRGNLILGCPEFKDLGHPGPRWQFLSREDGSSWQRVVHDFPSSLITRGIVERTVNPVHGDDSALVFPPGNLRYGYSRAIRYPEPRAEEYEYLLTFDYRIDGEANPSPRIIYQVIEYDRENRTNWRHRKTINGPAMRGDGEWERYEFRFTLIPEIDGDTGMHYPMIIRLDLGFDGDFGFANPFLEIL